MKKVGAYEAKTHLPKLLELVEQGERFTITKHGRPVAVLAPVARHNQEKVRSAIDNMRVFRKTLQERGVSPMCQPSCRPTS